MAIIKTVNKVSQEPTGEIEIKRQESGTVLLRIKQNDEVSVTLPPTLARLMAQLLALEAILAEKNDDKPHLTVVKD